MDRFASAPVALPMGGESMMMAPMQMSETSVSVTPEPTAAEQLVQAQDMIDFLNMIYKDEIKGNIDRKTWNEFMDHLEGWVDSLAEDYLNSTE